MKHVPCVTILTDGNCLECGDETDDWISFHQNIEVILSVQD